MFGVDLVTLRWTRIELSAAMDWYTRCIVGLRLTPVSTKAVDAAENRSRPDCRPRSAGPCVWSNETLSRGEVERLSETRGGTGLVRAAHFDWLSVYVVPSRCRSPPVRRCELAPPRGLTRCEMVGSRIGSVPE